MQKKKKVLKMEFLAMKIINLSRFVVDSSSLFKSRQIVRIHTVVQPEYRLVARITGCSTIACINTGSQT